MADPLLLRVSAETAEMLASDMMLAAIASTITVARRQWERGEAQTSMWSGHAAAQIVEQLRALCVVEDVPHAERTPALELIRAERIRHIEEKGYDARHDDRCTDGQLAGMAGWYADEHAGELEWPWEDDWPERGNRVQDLVRAGSLYAAEVDRLLRAGWRP